MAGNEYFFLLLLKSLFFQLVHTFGISLYYGKVNEAYCLADFFVKTIS